MSPLPLLATAGHVDHGKTSLVAALTGVNPDRLPEEQARGMTLDLGFAVLPLDRGGLSLVDVPGHERFVRTMLAGATGVDLLLLVVAADEGVMPQTREHLAIADLLGIPAGLVALTKRDRVPPERIAAATEELRRELAGPFLAAAPILPVSSTTGDGLPALRAALAAAAGAAAPRPADGPARLPLDRVFVMKGFGTVVTGTLASGRLAPGDPVVALPGGAAGGARGVQVHGQARPQALAGERVAVNLQGVERAALGRGEVLGRPGELEPSAVIDVELTCLGLVPRPLRRGEKVLFHALTTQENAVLVPLASDRLAPGARGLAQLHLGRKVALLPGDRFVLRGFAVLPGHGTTIGGGRVLRVLAARRRRPDPAYAERLGVLAGSTSLVDRVAFEVAEAGAAGMDRAGLRRRIGAGQGALTAAVAELVRRGDAVALAAEAGAVMDGRLIPELERTALAALADFHARDPLAGGLGTEELRAALGRRPEGIDARACTLVLERLRAAGKVVIDGELARLATAAPPAKGSAADEVLDRVARLFSAAGLEPPAPDAVAARLGLPGPVVRPALDRLLRAGALVRVRFDYYVAAAPLAALREKLGAHLAARGSISTQEWKALTGLSRKYAIPLAEHFDAEKLTVRAGDLRKPRAPVR